MDSRLKVDRSPHLEYNVSMPALTLSCGEGVLIWLQDRSLLTPGKPAADLRQAFQSVGINSEVHFTDELDRWELVLTPQAATQLPSRPTERVDHPDGFIFSASPLGIRLTGTHSRGMAFSIWELLERMGWEWPTPQIWREPQFQTWEFAEESTLHLPALRHRILFAEQVELTPEVVRWLSRLRFNTLFPSNPTRFSDPEDQLPDRSLEVAQDLGFGFIAGGDCLAWLMAPWGMETACSWDELSPEDLKHAEQSVVDLWQEMGEPKPRFSVWPDGGRADNTAKFLETLLMCDRRLLVETTAGMCLSSVESGRVLRHYREDGFPLELETGTVMEHLRGAVATGSEKDLYLFLDTCRWDSAIGNLVSPLLCRIQSHWIEAAARLGWGGACLSLAGLPSYSYLERAGFSLATCARVMWAGNDEACQDYHKALIRSQFEAGAPIVEAILRDAWEFAHQAVKQNRSRREPLERAHDFLISEEARDRFDQRAAELEESPPSEPCLELARSLATLTALHELEEYSDVHEERAMARTIWNQIGINRWPRWLQETSPLAEHLRNLLK